MQVVGMVQEMKDPSLNREFSKRSTAHTHMGLNEPRSDRYFRQRSMDRSGEAKSPSFGLRVRRTVSDQRRRAIVDTSFYAWTGERHRHHRRRDPCWNEPGFGVFRR